MPLIPVWCVAHCPNPQVNPCCFCSIRISAKLFQILNAVFLTVYCFAGNWWVFIHSKDARYMKRISDPNTEDECEKSILKYLNEKYYEAVLDKTIEVHERFGNTMFHINSLLRLRGYILTSLTIAFFSYLISSLFLVTIFGKSQKKNRARALRIGVGYVSFAILGMVFSILSAILFFFPVHSCLLATHRIPVVILTAIFVGPYKIFEIAVTVQYLRVIRIFTFDPEIKKLTKITAEEPGWIVAWWRRRNLPRDYQEKQAILTEKRKMLDQEAILKQLEAEEDEYRKRNLARIKCNEMAERITWMERVGRYRTSFPDETMVGDDSGIFSIQTSVTWGTNLTSSMSRSSPDSELSVENYMDNYEDYYDQMILQRGGSPSEHTSVVTENRPSIFTFKTMQLNKNKNKVKPKEEKKPQSSMSIYQPTASATSFKSTTSIPQYSMTETMATTASQSTVVDTKDKTISTKTQLRLLSSTISIGAPKIQDQTPSYSAIALSEFQNNVPPTKDKHKDKHKHKSSKNNPEIQPSDSKIGEESTEPKNKTKDSKKSKKLSKQSKTSLNKVDEKSKRHKTELNDDEDEGSKRPKTEFNEDEDEESKRPKIVIDKQLKVIKKNK